ncbi:MAG: hypothetical protein LIO53_05815 [Oscillospiraceae bacterium]|nr:hypothetical protein [Oscillospiraceae bacterium]
MSIDNMNGKFDWRKVFDLYNAVKYLYALCEESNPDLRTDLQPLNELRSALDHVMRIIAIETLNDYKGKDSSGKFEKLIGHLKRAFYDVCDSVTLNYRYKIAKLLTNYSVSEIQTALPEYYSEIVLSIEKISEKITSIRTDKRFSDASDSDFLDEYVNVIKQLNAWYEKVLAAQPSLSEISEKNKKIVMKNTVSQWIIPIAGIVIGAVIAVIGWLI